MRRRLLYLALVWAGVILAALFSYANASAGLPGSYASSSGTPAETLAVDCDNIDVQGLSKQMNMRAAWQLIYCGYAQGGSQRADIPAQAPIQRDGPRIGGVDRNVILPDAPFPKVTQSESMVWGNGNTVVVTFNDSRSSPTCNGGLAYSTDGGTTWQTNTAICTGHGNVLGDPIVVYNANLSTWFAGFIASGNCGSQGLALWTSPDGVNWSTGGCIHIGNGDDRESMWVDNSPSSPFYGRMYVSWNNLGGGGGLINMTFSDNGTTWSTPVAVGVGSPFIRNGQLTGSHLDGTVFSSGHTEGGTETTYMFRSTNGGVNWTQHTINSFTPAGTNVGGCGFLAVPPIWRVPDWGQPAVGGQIAGQNVVHNVYAVRNGSDLGDVYYVRSTDNGTTWSTPLKLNTDSTTQPQWQPALSADSNGGIVAGWYDRRNTTNGTNYEYYGRISTDDGATWGPDEAISDVLIPQPSQPDGGFSGCYAGDYNYHSTLGNTHFMTWTDGRVQINGQNQQDVFFDSVVVGAGGTPTPTPIATNTVPPTATATPTTPPTTTSTGTATNTSTVLPTNTTTATSTSIPTNTATDTATNTPTSTITLAPTATPTACVVPFTDVPPDAWFYGYVEWMYCNGVINGYNTMPPCETPGGPCFKPENNTTRGQIAKIVVLAFEFPIDITGGPHFSDVLPGHTFYDYIETAYNEELINGYGDGTYRPANNVTRGQIVKIVVNAAIVVDPGNWKLLNPGTNTFEDVPVGSTFFEYVETAAEHGLLEGYPCGIPPAGPCVPPDNKPYVLPGGNATRAQISKIVYLAVTYPPRK